MEFFGLIFLLPIVVAASLFLPALIHSLLGKIRFARLIAALLCGLFLISSAIEIALIAKFGIVMAHDKYYPVLDRMQGYNTIFGPLALTILSVLLLQNQNLKIIKWCAGFICFCALISSAVASLIYDSEAYYRTDSEGTYRIEEK